MANLVGSYLTLLSKLPGGPCQVTAKDVGIFGYHSGVVGGGDGRGWRYLQVSMGSN